MPLKAQIEADLKAAVKAGDSTRRDLLRMLKARILESEVQLRAKRGRDYALTDAETIEVVTQYAKQRRQSIDAYREAGREDLAGKEERELEALQPYLPRQLSREEIEALAREAIASSGASSAKDLGTVMKLVMPKVQGAADGKVVNEIVRGLLS